MEAVSPTIPAGEFPMILIPIDIVIGMKPPIRCALG
jgi:hypothetical protein